MKPRLLLVVLLLPAFCAPARADDEAFKFFDSEAQVVTALRRAERADEAPADVDVITRQEIEASGARDLCDLLRFRPGLDVIDGRNIGGNDRCVVSIRGMARDQVREMMVLINGRSVASPLSGTVLWEQLPVQMQDIERVEIVRGPNAALYGSGSGLGVINIITRAPKDRHTVTAAGTGGSLNEAISEESFEDKRGDFSYRLSHTFRHEDSFPSVSDDPANPPNDFLHSQKASGRALYRLSRATTLDVYAGGSWDTLGDPTGFQGIFGPSPQGRFRSHFENLRLAHSIDADNDVEVSLSRNEQVAVIDPNADLSPQFVRYYTYDLEALQSFGWGAGGRYHTTWGGQFQYEAADSPDLFGTGTPLQVNRVIRGFVHQSAKLTDKLSLIGGVSLEQPYYMGTRHADYQAAVLHQVVPGHVLRASYAMAHTNPGFTDAYSNFVAQHVAGFPVAVVIPNPFLKSYELQNYEVGYRGEFWQHRLSLGSSLYYMKIRDHVNIETLNNEGVVPPFNFGVQPLVYQYDNSNYLIARGMEWEATAHFAGGRSAYVNYSRETVTDRDGHSVYIKTTPDNIVNLGFLAPLAYGVTASANAGYKGGYLADSVSGFNQVSIPAFWRVDARIGYKPVPDLELFTGVRNLQAARHVEFVDGLTVPRTWYGGARVRFK